MHNLKKDPDPKKSENTDPETSFRIHYTALMIFSFVKKLGRVRYGTRSISKEFHCHHDNKYRKIGFLAVEQLFLDTEGAVNSHLQVFLIEIVI
jgi:hypothetical protein